MRRITAVDPPTIQPRGMMVPQVQGDFSAAEQAFNNAAINSQAAYEEQIRGLSAKMQTVQAVAEKQVKQQQASGAAVGEAIAGALTGVAQGLATFEDAKAKRKETEAKLKADEEKARQEALKQWQEGNYSSAYQGLAETLLNAQQQLADSTDKDGVFSVTRQGQEYINALIKSGQIGPEQAKLLNTFLFENINDYQRNQIENTRSVQRRTEDSTIEMQDAQFKQNILPLTSQLRANSSDPTIVDQLDRGITDQVQVRINSILEDSRLSEPAKMSAIADTLNYTREIIGDGYTELFRFQEAARRFETYQPMLDEANQLFDSGEISLQERDRRIAAARTMMTGTPELSATSAADAEEYALGVVTTQRGLYEAERERASDPENRLPTLNDFGLGEAMFQILSNQMTIEQFNRPGYEDQYEQIKQTYDKVTKAQAENQQLQGQITSYQADMAKAEAELQNLRSFAQPMAGESPEDFQRRRLRAEQNPNSGVSIATLEQDLNNAQIKYQEAQTKYQQAQTQYNNNYQFLSRYKLQDGLASYAEWTSTEAYAAQREQYTQAQVEIEERNRANSNFRTESQRSQSGGRRPPAGTLQRIGGDVNSSINLSGALSPFLSSRFQPGDIHITAHLKEGSHNQGNALDYAITGNPTNAGIVSMTSGTVTDIQNGCRVGDTNCGGGYGNLVTVRAPDGKQYLYAHFSSAAPLQIGDTVAQGQYLGTMGDTGNSYGTHLHLSVWDGVPNQGAPVPVANWATSIKPETAVGAPAIPSSGVSGYARVGPPQARSTGTGMPSDAVTFSNGAMYYQGRYYTASEVPADFRSSRGAQAPNPATAASYQQTPIARPARGVRASSTLAAYKEPNPTGANFGYRWISEQAGFRTKLNQVAQRVGVPTQWLADILATTSGGNFNRTQIKEGNRAGIALFSPGFLSSMGLDAQEVIHMNHTQQLDLLEKLLTGSNGQYAGKYRRMEQVAMAVFSGGDKALALGDYAKWDGANDGRYSIWNWLRQIGSHAGRTYATVAEAFDPVELTVTTSNGNRGAGAMANQTGSGVAPAWTGDGRRVAATELPPQVKAFLDLIFDAESGVGGADAYRIKAGGGYVSSLDRHPDESRSDNATGRYQFIGSTWREVSNQTGLRDFSPRSQDLNAVQLLKNIGAYDLIMQGKIQQAVHAAATQWAGFPMPNGLSNWEGQWGNTATITISEIYPLYNKHLEYYRSGTPAIRTSR